MTASPDTARPAVSICMMTYNGERLIERALESLLAQRYRDFELIMSDDCSDDATPAICRRVCANDNRVRFVSPPHNLGAQLNMRFALSHARGRYYVWASQDDEWSPEYLETLVGLLERDPEAICAMGGVRYVHVDGDGEREVRLSGQDLPERQTKLGLAVSILCKRSHEGESRIKNNIFMHGVWRTSAFRAAVEAHRDVFSNERQVLCQLVLAGRFRYADPCLFRKTYYGVKLSERRPASDPTVLAKASGGAWTGLRATLVAVARSPLISWPLKLAAVPTLFAAYIWYARVVPAFMGVTTLALRRLLPNGTYESGRRWWHGRNKRPFRN